MKFKIIETEHLILKGLFPEDMSYIFNNFEKEKIKEILGHRSEEEYNKEEKKHQQGYASYNRSFLLFLICSKNSGKIIGRAGIHNWNKEHYRAEIGYVMEEEDYKRKGLMSEAVKAIIEYGFKELKLNRLEALVGKNNTASLRIIEKNNFVKEGVLKQHYYLNNGFEDSIVFSLLAEDYNGL